MAITVEGKIPRFSNIPKHYRMMLRDFFVDIDSTIPHFASNKELLRQAIKHHYVIVPSNRRFSTKDTARLLRWLYHHLFEYYGPVEPDEPKPEKPPAPKRKPKISESRVKALEFLRSWQWRTLRYEVLLKHGRRCMCCGATPDDGMTVLHVDHIKPRNTHPELALEPSNLQVLCEVCNMGKGAWDDTDFRP